MTPPLSFRPAKPSDARACVQIIRDWGDETAWMVIIDQTEDMIVFWQNMFRDEHAWVAEDAAGIAGFCARSDDNISALYVAARARRIGAGKRLLDLAKQNRTWITVWAYEKNTDARRFYRREGLIEISREMEVYDDGSQLMDVQHRWHRPA